MRSCTFCEAALAPGTRFCPQCGAGVDTGAAIDPARVAPSNPYASPSAPIGYYVAATSSLAIGSLIAGIAAWFGLLFIGAIAAVILGHMAKSEIRSSGGRLTGEGLATGGLILGYLQLGLIALVVVVALVVAVIAYAMAK